MNVACMIYIYIIVYTCIYIYIIPRLSSRPPWPEIREQILLRGHQTILHVLHKHL